ncbi:hypothetical protein HKCCE3408_10415 [Rhodobacterales bacterium HKCCE3408]|nr:hypothetical protein [Rhodobacterales bacterium HKCCE3408]
MIWSPKRYALVYVGTLIALVVLSAVLTALTGINFGSAAVPLIPVFAAAMVEGQRHARIVTEMPPGGEIWRAALPMSAVALGGLVVWNAIILALNPVAMAAMRANPSVMIGVFAVYAALFIPLNRMFWATGFKSERRRTGSGGGR